MVQGLINADLAGHPAPDGLPGEVHELRQQMATAREALRIDVPRAADEDRTAYSVALLRTLARIDRQLDECEEAIDLILAALPYQPDVRARCHRCHRQAPTAGNRIAAHASGSMWCSGTGSARRASDLFVEPACEEVSLFGFTTSKSITGALPTA